MSKRMPTPESTIRFELNCCVLKNLLNNKSSILDDYGKKVIFLEFWKVINELSNLTYEQGSKRNVLISIYRCNISLNQYVTESDLLAAVDKLYLWHRHNICNLSVIEIMSNYIVKSDISILLQNLASTTIEKVQTDVSSTFVKTHNKHSMSSTSTNDTSSSVESYNNQNLYRLIIDNKTGRWNIFTFSDDSMFTDINHELNIKTPGLTYVYTTKEFSDAIHTGKKVCQSNLTPNGIERCTYCVRYGLNNTVHIRPIDICTVSMKLNVECCPIIYCSKVHLKVCDKKDMVGHMNTIRCSYRHWCLIDRSINHNSYVNTNHYSRKTKRLCIKQYHQ